jgi:hypothetical protein
MVMVADWNSKAANSMLEAYSTIGDTLYYP